MADSQILEPDTFVTLPWKNGLGSTLELLIEGDKGDGMFDWRLSMAPVVVDGAFSDFTGYQRTLMLIQGNGITLEYGETGKDILSQRFDTACFDGGVATRASLHDGAITDFNLMTQSKACAGKLTVLREGIGLVEDKNCSRLAFYALDSDVRLTSEREAYSLPAQHLLLVKNSLGSQWQVVGGPVIGVQIFYHHG